MVALSALEYLQGLLTFLAVIISGLAWIFIYSAYWGDSTTFLLIIGSGQQLDWTVYFFLCNVFVPLGLVLWTFGITNLIMKKKKRMSKIIILIISIIYEIAYLLILFTNSSLIGTPKGPFTVQFALFVDLFLLFSIGFFLVTGFLFVRSSLLSENKEIRLKGNFLLIAFISFAIGTFTDVIFEVTEISIALARIFLILSSFFFYVGFTLPKWIKKLFLQDSDRNP
jgi:hypothetical protein